MNIHGLERRVAVPHQGLDIGLALQHRDDRVQIAGRNVKADGLAGSVRGALRQGRSGQGAKRQEAAGRRVSGACQRGSSLMYHGMFS